jgi:hypothetical protein
LKVVQNQERTPSSDGKSFDSTTQVCNHLLDDPGFKFRYVIRRIPAVEDRQEQVFTPIKRPLFILEGIRKHRIDGVDERRNTLIDQVRSEPGAVLHQKPVVEIRKQQIFTPVGGLLALEAVRKHHIDEIGKRRDDQVLIHGKHYPISKGVDGSWPLVFQLCRDQPR